jgi:hypothetical protein
LVSAVTSARTSAHPTGITGTVTIWTAATGGSQITGTDILKVSTDTNKYFADIVVAGTVSGNNSTARMELVVAATPAVATATTGQINRYSLPLASNLAVAGYEGADGTVAKLLGLMNPFPDIETGYTATVKVFDGAVNDADNGLAGTVRLEAKSYNVRIAVTHTDSGHVAYRTIAVPVTIAPVADAASKLTAPAAIALALIDSEGDNTLDDLRTVINNSVNEQLTTIGGGFIRQGDAVFFATATATAALPTPMTEELLDMLPTLADSFTLYAEITVRDSASRDAKVRIPIIVTKETPVIISARGLNSNIGTGIAIPWTTWGVESWNALDVTTIGDFVTYIEGTNAANTAIFTGFNNTNFEATIAIFTTETGSALATLTAPVTGTTVVWLEITVKDRGNDETYVVPQRIRITAIP